MAFSDYMPQYYRSPMLPDWAQLGGRIVVTDGVNPNLALSGAAAADRILGCMPQPVLVAALWNNAGTNVALVAGETYTYGVRRVVRSGGLTIYSAMTTAVLANDAGADRDGRVTLTEYPYLPNAAPASSWTLAYQVWRSKAGAATVLYLVDELTQAEFEGLAAGVFEDTTADADLATAQTYTTTDTDTHQWVPPCRYVRAWKNRLLLAGTARYSYGTALVSAGTLATVTLQTPGQVRASDVGAYVQIEGEATLGLVAAADEDANTWTLAVPCAGAHDPAVGYALFRDWDTAYLTAALPADIEGYSAGTELYSAAHGGDEIRGLAVLGNFAYLLRRSSIDSVEYDGTSFVATPIVGGVGCVSHATIADETQQCPLVLRYAGRAGVWALEGASDTCISAAIEPLIRDQVDHTYDPWTHGVWDAQRGLYWLWLFGTGEVADLGVRIPQLCLVWSLRRKEWYRYELPASRSAVIRDEGGENIVAIGVAGGWARADLGTFDGADESGVVSAATANTLEDADAAFPIAENGLAGLPVLVTAADGTVQRRLVKTNTATELTIYGTWATTPVAGAAYHVGAIRWSVTPREFGLVQAEQVRPDLVKRITRVAVAHQRTAESAPVTLTVTALGDEADPAVTLAGDLGAGRQIQARAPELALRGRTFSLALAGAGTQAVTLRAVIVETDDVVKGTHA